jgi:putative permease
MGIMGAVSWLTFGLLGLDFGMLLAALTGLSVLVPYIGVAVVSVPVTLVAFFQFGASGEFVAVVGAYAILQAIDGNLLAPLLISEVVDLHPIAVIAAILIFGGIWGFWGVFFSIPLATVAVAVQKAWPDPNELPQRDPTDMEAA